MNIDVEKRRELQASWNKPVVAPLVFVVLILLLLIIPGYLTYQRRQQRTIGE